MKHHTSKSVRLLSFLLSLCLAGQLGAAAWAAEVSVEEGMLSPKASASEPVQSEEEAPQAEGSMTEGQESTGEPEETASTTSEVEVQDGENAEETSQPEAETSADSRSAGEEEAEPEWDSPEFWEVFREEYADDGDYLKRYEAYQEQGVKRAFEDDDDIPGTVEALSEEELELMAASNSTKSPFTGKTYPHAASKKGKKVIHGLDVSKWQYDIDWKKVKAAGVDFAFIRCGRTRLSKFDMGEDEYFKKNVEGASAAGVRVGVYYFSQAVNESEAKKEAEYTLKLIEPYKDKITMPVVMDYERASGARINKVSRTTGTKVIKKYLKTVADGGYRAYIYANSYDLTTFCDVAQISQYGYWYAWYQANDGKSKPSAPTYSGSYDFWQYSSKGKVNGIKGNADCNFWYSDNGELPPAPDEDEKPAQVTGLTVTAVGDTYLDLKWDVVSNAEHYKVEGKANGGSFEELTTSVGNTCRVQSLTPQTSYTLRVKAVNAKGTGSASASVTVTTAVTQPEPEPEPMKRTDLPAPELVSAVSAQGGVLFKWKMVNEAELFRVFRKPKGGKWSALADTSDLSFLDKSAKSGTWYCYTVRCINASDKSYAGSFDKNGKSLTYYAAPALTKAQYSGGKVKLTCKTVKGVPQYRFFRRSGSGKWKTVATTTSASAVDKSAKAGEVYRYTVRGVSKDGKKYLTGFDSEGLSTFASPVPKLSSAKNSKAKTIAMKWSKTAGAQGYEVRWVQGKKTERKTVSGGGKTSASFGNLTKGKTYRVSVRAYKKVGDKLWYSSWCGSVKVKVGK